MENIESKELNNFIDYVNMIDEPNRSSCLKLYNDYEDYFLKAKGSGFKHQAWEGGYIDHIKETMEIGIELYNTMGKKRKFEFSLSDVLLVLYLHDLEKPWKYSGKNEMKSELESFVDYKDFINSKVDEYGFVLTSEHKNGLKYIHGEGNDYNKEERIQGPLSAFVHICDTFSARIWFDFPKRDLKDITEKTKKNISEKII